MRLNSWAILAFFGSIVAAIIPLEKSHELHLRYFPTDTTDDLDSYLSLIWQMKNNSLYVNGDRVFPPSLSMQLHAPRYNSETDTPTDQKDVSLAYSLEARPLSAEEVGPKTRIVRVNVELLDLNGMAVTDDAVVIDMLANTNGSHHITRIQVEPSKGLGGPPDDDSDSSRAYKHSPFWAPFARPPPPSSHPPHRGPHRHPRPHHGNHGHRRHGHPNLTQTVAIPAMLGVIAGLMACVFGYAMGHILLSLWRRVSRCRNSAPIRRFRTLDVEESLDLEMEDGTDGEKSGLMSSKTGPGARDPEEE